MLIKNIAAKQKNDHRILINKVEDKRPIIESTLLAGRHFLEAETIETDCNYSFF